MEFLSVVVYWFAENWEKLFAAIGGFAVLATMTPNETDNKIVKRILDAINFMGANIGMAKNFVPAPPPPAPIAVTPAT